MQLVAKFSHEADAKEAQTHISELGQARAVGGHLLVGQIAVDERLQDLPAVRSLYRYNAQFGSEVF
ncbi:hypothetical protein M5D96_007359 [Drosophila gunungcola]|uniref:Uncharacterized protein n=1 Tax=Drosophila gunungcola TaxID=103775 RepID=A0A9Q0BQD0_9MUSC|nr:hypothetical protein M5D96_007359 [Drosophila gunungcola]